MNTLHYASISAKLVGLCRHLAQLLFLVVFGACTTIPDQDVETRNVQVIPGVFMDPVLLEQGYVYVSKVVDGDTFWVHDGTNHFKVRFIGIDAPELRSSRWKKKGFYAQEAKGYVQKRTEHKWVRLVLDVQKQDRYQRTLAYIYLQDGTFLNAELVAKGYALVATFPPNIRQVDVFVELQRLARETKSGLWAE